MKGTPIHLNKRTRRFHYLLLGIGLFIPSISPRAQSFSRDQVQATLSNYAVIRGDFVQTRHIALFSDPLESSGRFTLADGYGLYWQQTSPFDITILATDNALMQRIAEGPTEIITAAEQPAMLHFIRLMLSLISGDLLALEETFDYAFADQATHWTLVLTPHSAPLNELFHTIEVRGTGYIDAVTIQEAEGDHMEIHFSNQRSKPTDLTKDERDAFAL